MASGFNISTFASSVHKNGIMRPSKFLVRIPYPRGMVEHVSLKETARYLELWCDSSNIPSIALATNDIHRYGYGNLEKKPYLALNNDINMTFISDGNATIWTFFQQWIRMIINYDMRNGIQGESRNNGVLADQKPFELAYKNEYVSDIELIVFNDQTNKPSLEIVLREAYPIFVGDMPLNWADTSSIMRVPVSFTVYDWYHKTQEFNNKIGSDNKTFEERLKELSNGLIDIKPQPQPSNPVENTPGVEIYNQ
jgi:hypothetical protein